MVVGRKGTVGLTERLDVRVAPAEKAALREMAAVAGMPVAELREGAGARAAGRVAYRHDYDPRAATPRRPPQARPRRE